MLRTILKGSICLMGAAFVFGSTAMANPPMPRNVPWFAGINYVSQGFGDLEGRGINGDGVSVFAGYALNNRVALELSYTETDIDTFSVGGTSFPDEETSFVSFSVTYDFDDWQGVTPFARVGFADNTENAEADGVRVEVSGRGFFAGLGVLYSLSPSVDFRIEYQRADSDNHNWSVGPKFSF